MALALLCMREGASGGPWVRGGGPWVGAGRMEEVAEEALPQGETGPGNGKVCAGAGGRFAFSARHPPHGKRRAPCMFNRASLRGRPERRRPAHLRTGRWSGCLAAASDHQTRLGAPRARPGGWPPAGLLSRLPCAPSLRGVPPLRGPLCQALLQDREPPWGLETLQARGPQLWSPGSGPNVKTWGFIQRLSTLRCFPQFLHYQEVK